MPEDMFKHTSLGSGKHQSQRYQECKPESCGGRPGHTSELQAQQTLWPGGVRARLLRWQFRETKFLGQTWKEDMSARLAQNKGGWYGSGDPLAQCTWSPRHTRVSGLSGMLVLEVWRNAGGWQESLELSQGASSLKMRGCPQAHENSCSQELSLGQLLLLDSHRQPSAGSHCHGFGAGCPYSVF